MPATVEVEGMNASPGELEDAGWTAAFRSRKGDVRNGSSGGGGQRGGVKASAGLARCKKLCDEARAQALSMAAGLTEDQTKEDTVCPNKVQNIVVVSTPHELNAMKYARVCKIYTRMGSFEVSAYVASPENTCKGVLRNIDPLIDDEALKRMVVTARNPTVWRGRSRSATRTDAAGQRSSQREVSARSLSRIRSRPDKHTTWADKAKNQPQPGPPERKGRSQVRGRSEHAVNPRMLALEAENKQLKRDLAELKAAFESFKERAQGDQKELGALWG
ncbi:hypothetical protein MTO96_034942 [Rhipicephalus appendiculatus]